MPMMQEQEVQVPKIIMQTRVQHQHVEQTMEIPVPMTQEQVVHVCSCDKGDYTDSGAATACGADRGGSNPNATGRSGACAQDDHSDTCSAAACGADCGRTKSND